MRHSPTACVVAPSTGRRGDISVCPGCGRNWVDTGTHRTTFFGALLGTQREDDGSRARLLFKPRGQR